jgi:hypothetical protein
VVQDRAKAEAIRTKYLKRIEEKEKRRRELQERLTQLDYLEKEADNAKEPLVERANTNMRAGAGTATTTGAASVALIVKFGMVLAPVLVIPLVGVIWAANALADRNDTRRLFQGISSDLGTEKLERTTELGRVEHELDTLQKGLQRVEEIWRKTQR